MSGFCFPSIHWERIGTRMRSRWGAIANPHTEVFFIHPAPPSRMPGSWPQQQNQNSVQYVYNILFVRTHTKNGIKSKNWHGSLNLMIFDLLTLPQGHQFDPRMKTLLAFCSVRHPRRFDMPHDHVWIFLTPLDTPAPQSPTPWAWPRRHNANPVWYVLYLLFVRTHTNFGIKKSLKLTL